MQKADFDICQAAQCFPADYTFYLFCGIGQNSLYNKGEWCLVKRDDIAGPSPGKDAPYAAGAARQSLDWRMAPVPLAGSDT